MRGGRREEERERRDGIYEARLSGTGKHFICSDPPSPGSRELSGAFLPGLEIKGNLFTSSLLTPSIKSLPTTYTQSLSISTKSRGLHLTIFGN